MRKERKNYECKKIKLHINIIKKFLFIKKKKYDFSYKYFFKIEINIKIRVLMFIKNKKFFSQYVPRERESTGRLGDSLMAWKGREETAGEAT